MVDIQDNPLYFAAIGGLIIGVSTSLNYAFRGNVTGMSGMLYSTVTLDKHQMPKNIAIIGGMLLIGGIFFDIFQYRTSNGFTPFGPESQITVSTSQLGYALAGILVGFGTKLSNGCTSGHGLCGLARMSVRSLAAVLTFLISGFVIATIIYHAGGLGPFTESKFSPNMVYDHEITANICIILGVLLPLIGLYLRIKHANQSVTQLNTTASGQKSSSSDGKFQRLNTNQYFVKDQLIVFLVGLIFGAGLLVAGMVRRTNIIYFLALGKDWNPSLMFVLGSGLAVNLVFFTYMIKVRGEPFFGETLFNPNNKIIDAKLIGGAVCFGLGWGIGGLCPGPALMQTPIFTIDVHFIWFPFFFLGQFIANKLNEMNSSQNQNSKKQTFAMKQTPSSIIQNAVLVKKDSPKIQFKMDDVIENEELEEKEKQSSQQKQDAIAEILHQHGHGYFHANKLPTIVKQKSINHQLKVNHYGHHGAHQTFESKLKDQLMVEKNN